MSGYRKLISFQKILEFLEKNNLSFTVINSPVNATYKGIETDSRAVEKDDIFVCISGFKQDGHDFAEEAIKNGAALLIVEKKINVNLPQIKSINSRKAAAILAKLFFNDPTSKIKLIGITGTNGKTTVAYLISKLLIANNKKTGLIGTFGYEIDGKKYRSERTTPDIIDLNKIFYKMSEAKVEYAVMEVSSHSLILDRVFGLHFDAAVFTNLTSEHLDFHKNMEEYAKAKFKLFAQVSENNGIAIINTDDIYGKKLYRKLKCSKKSISFIEGDISIKNSKYDLNESSFTLIYGKSEETYQTQLTGKYNIQNTAAVITVIKHFLPEVSFTELNGSLKKIKRIPGRLERVCPQTHPQPLSLAKRGENMESPTRFSNSVSPLYQRGIRGVSDRKKRLYGKPLDRFKKNIFIDYAHTPDALENVLKTLKEISDERIICVFGAGGDRDKQKRPQMLKAVLKFSNLAIITSDNPRFEDPQDIIADIISTSDPMLPYWIQPDRRLAIRTAIDLAGEEDIVLLAGKGHETFQAIKGKNYHFSDKEEVLKFFKTKNEPNENGLSIPIDIMQLEVLFDHKIRSKESRSFHSISTDSRTIKENSIFFALKGENFDGHDYIEEVLKQKNCLAVVNKDYPEKNKNLVFVDNTVEAFGKLARKYKSLFNITAIALTGSIGKTTTKEYIFNIFSDSGNTLKTFANENNLIGLPKTIFRLKPEYKYAIFELGSNHFGEIGKLAEICNPDIGIITFVGPAHLEFFKDENGVYREKTSLFRRNIKTKIFPGDDARFKEFKGITFGNTGNCYYRISKIAKKGNDTEFYINKQKFLIPTPFDYFCLNAAIAIALSKELGISTEKIKKSLLKPLQISQRMEIKKTRDHILLIDCYNANPDSMLAAIDFWKNFKREKRHIAILGDMLELGNLTEKLHEKAWCALKKIKNKFVISVGKYSKFYRADLHFEDVEKLLNAKVFVTLPKDSVILIKASHGIHLEKIIERI